MAPERAPIVATLAACAAVLGGLGALLGPALAHVEAIAPMQGFGLFLLGALVSAAGLVLGALGLRATRGGRAGRERAWFAVAVGVAALAVVLSGAFRGRSVPRINDITTDPDDAPVFEQAAREEANRERDLAYPATFAAQQRTAYPDLAPIELDVPPAEAFDRARRAAEALGWEITRSDPARGALEARERSWLFRFVDDVVVRVRPAGGVAGASGSVVDVRSKSRDGQGDLGVNAARIRAFAAQLGGAAPR